MRIVMPGMRKLTAKVTVNGPEIKTTAILTCDGLQRPVLEIKCEFSRGYMPELVTAHTENAANQVLRYLPDMALNCVAPMLGKFTV